MSRPCQNCRRVLRSTQGPLCRTCYRKTGIRVKRCKASGAGRGRKPDLRQNHMRRAA